MLGSSSTVYNEQPTSAEMLPSRACTERGYGTNIQRFDQNPTYKRVCRAHPHTYGKTPTGGNRHECISAHPRAYGENQGDNRTIGDMRGSSPRIRGTLFIVSCCWFHHRLTPAHTGNAITNVKRSHLMHGSSPCIQGIPGIPVCTVLLCRLIPVYTGNTAGCSGSKYSVAAHPRVYREYT